MLIDSSEMIKGYSSYRKSQGHDKRQGSGDTGYKAASCESEEESEDVEKAGHVTVNNINLTININIENTSNGAEASSGDRHFVVTEENSKKLLNLVQSVISQNAK